MVKEIKYFIYIILILTFVFSSGKYYYSDINKKKSYRSLADIDKKINVYSQKLPILNNDTNNIIEYVENSKTKKKKKYYFWELIDKND
jgi:hypothetical protein|tara:strand:+ start:221 stop:484 length:264 start_codon:yes stop_codon:yes gene_type:complete